MTVFVRLAGGLGNQMFQYAAARALAERMGAAVAWDARALRRGPGGTPALARLAVAGRAATGAELAALSPLRRLVAQLRARLGGGGGWHAERSLAYDPRVAALPDGAVLDGYYQSERYFAAIRARLLAEFAPRAAPPPAVAARMAAIRAAAAAALHVRRGDYTQPRMARVHGLCSPGYYRAGLARLAAVAPAAPLYVFSDDPAWCRAALALPAGAVLVEGNAPEWDIALMAACRHRIIANSSFSWWGAWLGDPGGLTIAPEPWFDDPALDGGGIAPAGWLRLPKAG